MLRRFFAGSIWLLVFNGAIFWAGSVTAASAKKAPTAAAPTSHKAEPKVRAEKLTFTNQVKDGKKTWMPLNATIKAGEDLELTLINTLAEPHGFTAPGLVEPIVVGGNETRTLRIHTSKAKAQTYKYSCQLHPAHVGGTITVK